ncbi:RNA-directed DNA polymerase, eukaryota [Tanacetum coccineum]
MRFQEKPTGSLGFVSLESNATKANNISLIKKYVSTGSLIEGVQETKMTRLELCLDRSLWGNSYFEVASIKAIVIVEGEVVGSDIICYLVNLYAPQERNEKIELWDYISRFIRDHEGEFLLFGDFNAVRYAHERSSIEFCRHTTEDFNKFIMNSNLVDMQMGGRRFTRVDKNFGVALEDVEQCSGVIGCSTASLPFTYLGLPVGSNMNIKSNWDELILKVQKKLANWKIKFLSIGGRLTLLKIVHGSLGFGSHGANHKKNGVWSSIVKASYHMHFKNIIPISSIHKRIGNGSNTRFWTDIWVGTLSLKDRFPRVFTLEMIKDCMVSDRWYEDQWNWNWNLNRIMPMVGRTGQQFFELQNLLQNLEWSDNEDTWIWDLDHNGLFFVSNARIHIDSSLW